MVQKGTGIVCKYRASCACKDHASVRFTYIKFTRVKNTIGGRGGYKKKEKDKKK